MGTATLKNIIIAALIILPLKMAHAEVSPTLEAGVACSTDACLFKGQAAFGQPLLQHISTESIPVNNRGTAGGFALEAPSKVSQLTPLSYKLGRVETVNPVEFEGQKGISEANGVIIGPCLMITNQHVVFGDDRNPDPNVDHSINFFFGEGTTSFKWKRKGTPVYWPERPLSGARDYVLVKLDTCPGKKVGWIEPVAHTDDQLLSENLTLAGIRPGPSNGEISTQLNLRGVRFHAGTGALVYTAKSIPGLSASSVLDDSGNLVGINKAIHDSNSSIAVTMSEVLSDPKALEIIRADRLAFAQESQTKTETASISRPSVSRP